MTVTRGTAEVEPGLRLHYATAGAGERTVVLLHGFPQTCTSGDTFSRRLSMLASES
jgi:hypothetical protein